MADRDPNQANLEAFNQELSEVIVPRNKRRSSILKAVDNNVPEDRRQSRRISFHTNILCQQILPDGTTQVITEALKAKLPDSSASTAGDESRPSLPDKVDDDNTRKRSTTCGTNSASGVKKRKDPKSVAQSYQNFIKRTYDAENQNDYDTVFNTSVNRNGFPVASRDQRLDVTKLFAVDQIGGVMDITKLLTSSDESHVQNENDVSGAQTRVFTDLSMSLEESLNEVANVSEMDTAMIIDDDVFDNSDEQEAEKEIVSSPAKQLVVETQSEQIPRPVHEPEAQIRDADPEPAVVIMDQESIVDVSMSIVSDMDNAASQEPVEKTEVFEDCQMEVTEAVDAVKVAEEGDKTQVFSQGASIAIEKNLSKDISPCSSQQSGSQPTSLHPPLTDHREAELFQDKSASFRNTKALTLAFSRVSFPRNLDKVLKQRREQMNRTLQTLKDADISSDIDSYSDSPRPSFQNESSAASVHVPDATSVMFEKTSLITHSVDASSMREDSVSDVVSDMAGEQVQSQELRSERSESSRHITPVSVSSGFLAPAASSQSSSQESEAVPGKSQKVGSSKGSSDSHFLSSSTGFTSFDESGSESGDVSCFEQELLNVRKSNDDDEEEDDLHEGSLFELYQGAESSFLISPDSSFHSSFVCQDDTLLLLGDDIDAKLKQFIGSSSFAEETAKSVVDEGRDLTFVPLRTFDAERNGVTLVTDDPDHLFAFFMFATIKLTVDLGATLRSFNGIPIKVIKRAGIESAMTEPDFVIQDDGRSLVDYSDEKMKGLLTIAHDMLISAFDCRKSDLISKYSTSDQLSDLVNEISDLVNESKTFLQELSLLSLLYPMQLYRKNGKEYDLAFQLPGRRRNFFLILAVDPATYPFKSMKVRFGFDHADLSLYHVNNFAKALSLVVKPGKNYMTRTIEAAKETVRIMSRLSLSKK